MNVTDRLVWLPTYRPEGVINFRNARARQIVDARSTWPVSQAIVLDGFAYDAIFCRPEDASAPERIRWLQTNHRYSPQPYEQLASVYRKQGNASAARQVAIAKQVARRKEGGLRWWEKAWSKLLGATVGYGYRPWLAALWVAGLWLLGLALFERGPAHARVMMGLGGGPRPRFVAWIYVLDSLLPIVNLRQREYWVPNVARPWGWLYLDLVLFAAVAGWALATAVVAALTGLIHKD
jgi:hypothetical protein